MLLDLVDVFGAGPMRGNPLAVVRGGEGLTGAQMQALTQWLGFSETAFLLPPDDPAADYRVRIFYPAGELSFAGHPTLGSCQSWLAAGGAPKRGDRIVQECGVGLVEVRAERDQLAFRAPPPIRTGPLSSEERAELIAIAGVSESQVLDAVHVDNGTGYKLLRLPSAASVLAVEPQAKVPLRTNFGLIGPTDPVEEADFEIRGFFADSHGTLVEDPITGSLNATTAQHLFASGLTQGSYVAAQGRKVGADGRIHCRQDPDGSVWIGGRADMIAAGAALSDLP